MGAIIAAAVALIAAVLAFIYIPGPINWIAGLVLLVVAVVIAVNGVPHRL